MSIRMTGMYSNLDTDSIISQLMKAQRTKIESVEKKKTALEWKVDAWKTLNAKIYALYTGSLSEMRYSTFYGDKTSTISDTSVATVTASSSAVNGTQELSVQKLAKSGYLTGGQIGTDLATLSSSSTLADLGYSDSDTATFEITVGSNDPVSISVSSTSTINDVISKLKSAGVNASFDATNKRIFVNSSTSGASADFKITSSDANGLSALDALGLSSTTATKIDGQDAEITLNGATFTSSTNAFSINGLTIVAQAETGSSTVTINTSLDYDGVYDKIKDFLTEYNALITEMDSLYNADSAKGYEPLTDDEKEAMSEAQIEKWESKIKDALLRRDSTLSDVTSTLKSAMSSTLEINGTKYNLASFGISTGSYFSTDENERGVYHIDGDSEDSTTSGNTDKLKSALASDPESVSAFFTKLSSSVYSALNDKMKSITGIRTVYNVYEDKKMASDIEDYEDRIDELEEKFTTMEDRYYSQFSAMETALAKLQSSSSSLSSLLGTS